MNMAYTTNEKIPRVHASAVRMVRSGKSTREVARHFRYNQSSIVRWCKKAGIVVGARIETKNSAPKTSPQSLPEETVGRIIYARIKSKRCAEVVFQIPKLKELKFHFHRSEERFLSIILIFTKKIAHHYDERLLTDRKLTATQPDETPTNRRDCSGRLPRDQPSFRLRYHLHQGFPCGFHHHDCNL